MDQKPIEVVLALAILESFRRREESYDHEAADKAAEVARLEREADPNNIYKGHVDYSRFYRLTMLSACAPAGILQQPVYLLCECAGNDAQEWAVDILAKAGIDIPGLPVG